MLNQIYSEWIKVKSVRSTVVMFIVAAVLSALFAGLGQIAANGDRRPIDIFVGIAFSQVLFMVLGVQIIGQEYRFNTIRATFAATPNRLKVIFSKLIVLISAVVLTTVFLIVLSIIAAQISLALQGYSIDFSEDGGLVFVTSLFSVSIVYAVFGFAVGSILKQPIAGIVLAIIYALIVENIIFGILMLLDSTLYKWLPFMAVSGMTGLATSDDQFEVLSVQSSYIYAVLVFGGLVAIGAFLIKRRDA